MFAENIYNPWSFPQVLGYLATVFGVIGFQQKNDVKLRLFVLCMSACIVSHFILMGSYAAAISAGLAATRWGLSIFTSVLKYAKYLVPFYILLFVGTGYITYERWFDVLPIIASITGTYGLFYCHRLKLRIILLIGGAFWMAHNFFALSYGPFVMEMFIFLSNLTMIVRLLAENKKLPKDPRGSFLSRFG